MIQCPVCGSDQLVYIRGPRRTSCPYCEASWVQDEDDQKAVTRPGSQGESPSVTLPATVP